MNAAWLGLLKVAHGLFIPTTRAYPPSIVARLALVQSCATGEAGLRCPCRWWLGLGKPRQHIHDLVVGLLPGVIPVAARADRTQAAGPTLGQAVLGGRPPSYLPSVAGSHHFFARASLSIC